MIFDYWWEEKKRKRKAMHRGKQQKNNNKKRKYFERVAVEYICERARSNGSQRTHPFHEGGKNWANKNRGLERNVFGALITADVTQLVYSKI